MHPLLRATALATTAGAVGVGYAGLVERNLFTLRRASVPVLPPGIRPLRVLQITDLHLMPGQRRKLAWVRSLATLQPDLVVNTGDNIAHADSIEVLLRSLDPLLELPGVFVLGSNDYFAPKLKNPARYLMADYRRGVGHAPRLPTSRLVEGFRGAGWADLTNARVRMPVGDVALELVGVDDPHFDYDRYARVAAPADPSAALTVGVVHAPYRRVLDAMTADGAGLVIAGHTHGGQLCLPGVGALVTNCDLDRARAKGLSRWWPGAGASPAQSAPQDAAYLHVSAGLGTSPKAPVRFACRPEATLLTLDPRAG
ncbi:MAG: metallophosphoesterase [Dermatophilaceae bacterium]